MWFALTLCYYNNTHRSEFFFAAIAWDHTLYLATEWTPILLLQSRINDSHLAQNCLFFWLYILYYYNIAQYKLINHYIDTLFLLLHRKFSSFRWFLAVVDERQSRNWFTMHFDKRVFHAMHWKRHCKCVEKHDFLHSLFSLCTSIVNILCFLFPI